MATQRQEPGRDGGQPRRLRKRRSLPYCDVYMRTGVCVLGMTCLFNHPPERRADRQELQFILEGLEMLESPGYKILQTWVFANKMSKIQAALCDICASIDASRTSEFAQRIVAIASDYTKEHEGTQRYTKEHEELATLSNHSAYFSAEDNHSPVTGPSCSLDLSSSSLAKYFSTVDVVARGDCSRLDSSSELESVIEDSRVHWSELSSSNDSDGTGESNCEIFDNDTDGNRGRNREIFESLRLLPKYQRWLSCEVAPADILLGPKIAEGGQAEIFQVEVCSKRMGLAGRSGSVMKVFKKGYSLQELKSQWPDGLLFGGQLSSLFEGSMVLEDDRFALLLSRSDMDLRKLIDVTLDRYSPLIDRSGAPRLKELRAYRPKCLRSKCSTPVFSERCAEGIMFNIASEMKYLHSANILHRDLKASNILCSRAWVGCIGICVADYESSIGVVGTAFWRAPEILKQLKERKPGIHFTREADVYGFAMTCYEIWTGHIPFEDYRPNDSDHVLNGARPPLPDHVPSWVKDLIQRCWHQNPSERPSFSAIIKELEPRSIVYLLQLAVSGHTSIPHMGRSVIYLERSLEVFGTGS